MFPQLDHYQKEGYWSLMKIARRYGGAFLCDGVGLGKTFVGLMLIERLVLHENKRVVVFAPKAAREGVWEPHLREWLPHLGGLAGTADFSSLVLFSHTDLNRKGDFPERFRNITAQADAVIVDEAHPSATGVAKPDRTTRKTGVPATGGSMTCSMQRSAPSSLHRSGREGRYAAISRPDRPRTQPASGATGNIVCSRRENHRSS